MAGDGGAGVSCLEPPGMSASNDHFPTTVVRWARLRRIGCIAMLAALPGAVEVLPATAQGQDRPVQITPMHDVTVTYRLTVPVPPNTLLFRDLRLSRLAAGPVAAEIPDAKWRAVVNPGKSQAFFVDDARRTVTDVPVDAASAVVSPDAVLRSPELAWSRIGLKTVADQTCTDWVVAGGRFSGAVVCISADGVLLRTISPKGFRLEAFAISREPVSNELFILPDAYARSRAATANLPFGSPGMLRVLQQDRPSRMVPARDVTVSYKVGDGAGRELQVRQRADGGPARADLPDVQWWAVVDRHDGRAFSVSDADRKTQNWRDAIPLGRALPQGVLEHTALQWTRVGAAVVAGQACTDWIVSVEGRLLGAVGVACLTSDGVLLRVVPADAPRMEAFAVAYGPLPDDLFTLPTGYESRDEAHQTDPLPLPSR